MTEKLSFFINSEEWKDFKEHFNSSTLLTETGIFRYEDANTNFLRSLLDQNNTYGLGTIPMKLLIEFLASKGEESLSNIELNESDITIEDLETRKKFAFGIPDLFIHFKIKNIEKDFIIILEAKYQSFDVEYVKEQCQRYKDEIDKIYESKKYNKIYLFLSYEKDIHYDSFTTITYQDLINYLYYHCQLKAKNSTILEEYIRTFDLLYNKEVIENNLIPLTPKGKRLTEKLYEKHYNIICEIIKDKANEDIKKLYTEEKENLHILFNYLNSLYANNKSDEKFNHIRKNIEKFINKNKTTCKFNGKNCSRNDLIYEVFKYIIENKNIKSLDQLESINETTKNWRNIIPESEIEYEPKKEHYSLGKQRPHKEPLKIGEENYYHCTSNNEEDIDKFIEAVKKEYPNDEIISSINEIDQMNE